MTAAELTASLRRIGQVQPHLPGTTAVLLAVVALGALLPGIWLVAQHVTTMAHEGAHATLASSFGHRVDGITVNRKAFGKTRFSGNIGGFDRFFITFIGYLGPSAFGVAAAELINAGYIVAVLWIGLAGLLGVLLSLRRSFGMLTVTVAFVLLFLVAGFTRVGVQVVTAYLVAWFLLASGVRMIRVDGVRADDAQQLVKTTRIPALIWSGAWQLGAVAALVFGATLLV